MTPRFLSSNYLALLASVASTPALAQAPARDESFAPARVTVLPACPSNIPGTPDRNESVLALAGAGILAGAVSDLVKTGVQSLAVAIEQASREKAFGGEGSSAFQFYSLSQNDGDVSFESRLGVGEASCLILSVDEEQGELKAPAAGKPDDLPTPLLPALQKMKLPRPALYAEAYLRATGDGFIVQPHLIWYARRLKRSPETRLPIELQATFSTPGTAEVGSNAFAVARILLPAIAPGEVLTDTELNYRTSGALSPRPTTGAIDTRKQEVVAAWAVVAADAISLEESKVAVEHANQDLKAAVTGKIELQNKLISAKRAIATIERRAKRDSENAEALLPENFEDIGLTTVSVRLAFVRAPNKFGQAIAEALKGRATTTAAAVETALTTTLTAPSWSGAETTFVQASTAVATAQQAYDAAMSEEDKGVQASTLATLRNAQAAANAAAASAGRPLPYPGLLTMVSAP